MVIAKFLHSYIVFQKIKNNNLMALKTVAVDKPINK